MIIKQGNKEFFSIESCGRTVYYVYTINGRGTIGRESCYVYVKCDVCGKIVGTQFNGHLKHYKIHEKKSD
jgi:hypothetical protein